ncbi:MAG: STT3 domain-containing protein [Planctomycetota bacterium]
MGQVFRGPDDVRLLGADSYYHLRHARCAVREFPRLQRWDHATHYPHGERARTPGLFDLTLAAAALPAPTALPRVAAWAPVVLGLAAFAVLFVLVRLLAGRAAALLACLFLLLYPGGFLTRSLLGFADHHAAEVLRCPWPSSSSPGSGRPSTCCCSRRRSFFSRSRDSRGRET